MFVPTQVDGARVQAFGSPMKLSATPVRAVGSAPAFGEHNEIVLKGWLRVAAQDYDRYLAEGVI